MNTICPNEGDMNDCKAKPRCAWGGCEGQSLPSGPEDYCDFGYNFREEYCDCEIIPAQAFTTYWSYEDVVRSDCCSVCYDGAGNCAPNGNIYYATEIINLPYPQEYWIPSGVIHVQSISQFCTYGPINCGRTPESYGINFGVFFSTGQPYSLDYDYPPELGTGVFPCGMQDSGFILFRMQSDPTKVIGVLGVLGATGGVGCTYNSISLESIEPYTGT